MSANKELIQKDGIPYFLDSTVGDNFTQEDLDIISDHAISIAEKLEEEIMFVDIFVDVEGYLSYKPHYKRQIKRIRRITGYFSQVENFNCSKKAELEARKAHM